MGCYTVNKCWGLSQNNVLCYSWQNKILFVFFAATKRYIAWQRQKTGILVCSQTPQKMKANGMPTAIILETTGLSASLLR